MPAQPPKRSPMVQATLDRAVVLLREGRANSAEVLLATVAAEPSVRGRVQRLRGQIAYHLGRKEQAWQYLYEAIEADPAEGEAHGTFGILPHDRRLYPQAISAYSNALRLAGHVTANPSRVDWHCGLARALAAVGQRELALDSLRDALAIWPDHQDAKKGLSVLGGEAPADRDATDPGAPDEFAADPASAPADALVCDALFLEAMLHCGANNALRAKKIFERVLSLDPDHVNALCNLGALERNLGNVDMALPLLERAVARAPELAPARLALAAALTADGRMAEAVPHYRQALQAAPKDAAAHAGLAMALRETGDLDGAMTHFHKATEINQRQSPQFFAALGQTLAARGNRQGAEISFRHALALDSSLIVAQRGLEELSAPRGNA
jgi:tetratricopeptide (TPR) repeat protein